MNHAIIRNFFAGAVSFIGATVWTKTLAYLVQRRRLGAHAGRKIMHITTAPLFACTWPLYARSGYARVFAAIVPFSFSVRMTLRPGSDPLIRAVARQKRKDMASSGQAPNESGVGSVTEPIETNLSSKTLTADAFGPITYGVSISALTLAGWRNDTATSVALCALCAGDGMADVVGTAIGGQRLPLPRAIFRKKKTAAGSIACFFATITASLIWLNLPFITAGVSLSTLCASATAATVIELLPIEDNFTVPLAAFITTRLLTVRSMHNK